MPTNLEAGAIVNYWSGRADLNLSRFAGVSAAGARRRNPERTLRGISRIIGRDGQI